MSVFKELLNKGIYLKFNGGKELVGILTNVDELFITISSRGNKYTINKNEVAEIREASGEVEP